MRERVKERERVRSETSSIMTQLGSLDTSQMNDCEFYTYITWLRGYQKQVRERMDSLPQSIEDKNKRKAMERQVRNAYKALIVEDCRVFNPDAIHTLEQTRKVLQLEKKQFNTLYNELLKERQAQAAM